MTHRIRPRSTRIPTALAAMIALTLALGLVWTSQQGGQRALAQGAPVDCSSAVTNGSFESPVVSGHSVSVNAEGWQGVHILRNGTQYSTIPDGNQIAILSEDRNSLSQQLDTSNLLAGDVLTISFLYDNQLRVSLNSMTDLTTYTVNDDWTAFSISYTLVTDAEPVTLAFTWAEQFPAVESVTASCTRPAPTATPTATPSPTATIPPTATPSPTVEPTATPSPTVEPTATIAPVEHVELTVTGDPRFPVTGSAAHAPAGETYSLLEAPTHGTVAIDPDGTFTYQADSYLVTGDRFTVLASGGMQITVNVVLTIDLTVPTHGFVEPGGTGNGGTAEDARSGPSEPPVPAPTSTPAGNRVQR